MSRWAVVLAGGVGSRFWPLSTPSRPKQLLPLIDSEALLSGTLKRLASLVPPEKTLVLTNASLVEPIAATLPAFPRANIIAEPRPAGTAAALAWAAAEIARRDASDPVMVCVHADWAIGDDELFRATLDQALNAAAAHRALVTVGIVPDRADPGLGYIQPGDAMATDLFRVARFVEKPDEDRAREMVSSGYLWNSGIFAWRVADFLDEVRSHAPEVSGALADHAGAVPDADAFFAAARPVSVDVGVLERSSRVLVVPGRFGWDDVGTWGALRRARRGDAAGNVVSGDAHLVESSGNVVHSEGNTVVLFGVSDLVVVSRGPLTFVTTVEKSAHLKSMLDQLPENLQAKE